MITILIIYLVGYILSIFKTFGFCAIDREVDTVESKVFLLCLGSVFTFIIVTLVQLHDFKFRSTIKYFFRFTLLDMRLRLTAQTWTRIFKTELL